MREDQAHEDQASWYDEFATHLAGYDAKLATGVSTDNGVDLLFPNAPFEMQLRLARAGQCLLLLERIWPRASAA